jgi:phage repressor protein C with HTH and peptisase S24 domain/DNA-binding transcriptional regulator YiaG
VSTREEISTRIKSLRKQLGLTQEQFAHGLHFTRSYISQIEAQTKDPGSRFIRDLERAEQNPDLLLEAIEKSPASEGKPATRQGSYRLSTATGPRGALKRARIAAGFEVRDLAKKIGRPAGYVEALEDGRARISETTAELIVQELPALSAEELLAGSDSSLRGNDGVIGTVGARPGIATPPDVEARYVPLISWAQCGQLTDFEDVYDYEGYVAFNVQDRKAFAVTLRGDSMEPRYKAGDVAILYPSRKAETGNLVIAKIKNEGVVFKRFQILSREPSRFRFISENPNYEPIERGEEDLEWIYPVANVVQNTL